MTLIDKLKIVERKTAAEWGDYRLFALALRDDAVDRWDLLVSSKWIDEDRAAANRNLSGRVQAALDSSEIVQLSRIVFLQLNHPVVDALTKWVGVKHGLVEFSNCLADGIRFVHLFIVTADRSKFSRNGNTVDREGPRRPKRSPVRARTTARKARRKRASPRKP